MDITRQIDDPGIEQPRDFVRHGGLFVLKFNLIDGDSLNYKGKILYQAPRRESVEVFLSQYLSESNTFTPDFTGACCPR